MQIAKTTGDITSWCKTYIASALGVSPESIDAQQDFDELGLDSALITSMLIELEEWLELDIPPSMFFSQRTLEAMGAALADQAAKAA
ncbi:MAG: acyl carrier protein [Ramlibacter sp.]|nr:acyl carrier protein [Ramlibacter sp.]